MPGSSSPYLYKIFCYGCAIRVMLKVFVSHEGDIVNIMKLFDVANFNLSVVGKGHNGNLRCILYFHEGGYMV